MNSIIARPKTKLHSKFIWMFYLILIFSTSAKANTVKENRSQNNGITITNEITIKELFRIISEKTDYQIFYSNNLKELDEKVSLHIKNSSIENALDIAFEKVPLEYKIEGKSIVVRKKTIVAPKVIQPFEITGMVTNENGEPLPFVNIRIKGTNEGTVTNFDGKFILKIDIPAILLFSYLGYTEQTVEVKNTDPLLIKMMPEASQLNEVIISGVAGGTAKKKMSVSVSKINADDITLVPQSSIASSLQGKIAGVNVVKLSGSPGSDPNINLRGVTNINGNTGALVLVDGVILQGALADLNSDDIASIEVVKGAAASSLYGSRAGNGVIVITSKRGQDSEKGKTSISLRSELGIQQVAKYIDLNDSHPYSLATDYLDYSTFTKYDNISYPDGYISGWDPLISGNRVIKADAYSDQPYRINNDLQKEMFTNGASSTIYLGVGHKGDKTNLFLSFENSTDKGIVVETGGYHRYSLRANVDHSISDKLKISMSNNFIKTENNFMGGGTGAFFDVLMMEPDVNLFQKNTDGQEYIYYPNHWNTQVSNPLYDLWKKQSNSSKNRFLGNYEVKWILTDWLNFEGSYSFESQNYNSSDYTPYGTFNGLDASTNTLTTTGGSLYRYTSKIFNQNYRATLNSAKTWNDLEFKGKLSYLFENNLYENFSTEGANFTLPDLPSLNYFGSGSYTSNDQLEIVKAINYFAIASFVYKSRYILDALYRYDGSSLFGANERWNGYYRISGAYRLTQDIKIPYVEELKLRAAIGTSGQRPGFSYQYETYTVNNGTYIPETLGNTYLKPSNSKETEIGLDISFLKRFSFEGTFSETSTNDQFLRAPLASPFGGFQFQWMNGGTVKSQAFEFLLKSKIIDKPGLKFNLTVTFDKSNSKITKLDIPEYSTGPRSAFKIKEGEEYGAMYGVDFVRTLEQMQSQLLPNDDIKNYTVNVDGVVVKIADVGTIREKPFYVLDENGVKKSIKIGNITPDFNMGFNANLSYKNFIFYTLWKWKKGGDLYNGTAQYLVRDLRHPMMDQTNVAQENKKTVNYYQSLYDAQALNGFWVEKASYVRLSEVALYYNLAGTTLDKTNPFIKSIKVGLIGRNILTLTQYSGYDPDAGYDGFLFDNYGYPNFKNYSVSVEFKF